MTHEEQLHEMALRVYDAEERAAHAEQRATSAEEERKRACAMLAQSLEWKTFKDVLQWRQHLRKHLKPDSQMLYFPFYVSFSTPNLLSCLNDPLQIDIKTVTPVGRILLASFMYEAPLKFTPAFNLEKHNK